MNIRSLNFFNFSKANQKLIFSVKQKIFYPSFDGQYLLRYDVSKKILPHLVDGIFQDCFMENVMIGIGLMCLTTFQGSEFNWQWLVRATPGTGSNIRSARFILSASTFLRLQ